MFEETQILKKEVFCLPGKIYSNTSLIKMKGNELPFWHFLVKLFVLSEKLKKQLVMKNTVWSTHLLHRAVFTKVKRLKRTDNENSNKSYYGLAMNKFKKHLSLIDALVL